jgi:type II secretory pathway pseudopilin PulG
MNNFLKKFISNTQKQDGYTLAELSISTSIIAMLAVGGLSIMGKKNESDRVTETTAKIEVIETALKGYIRTNKLVPCPALPNLLESNTAFGKSVAYNATTHICDGGVTLTNGTGAVPVRTLNLDDDYSYDGWGRKFTYRTSDYSGAKLDFDAREFHGDLAIVDFNGINKTDINELPPFNNGAIYVIISHGSNGKSVAYGKNTTTAPESLATGFEKVNTDHTVKTYVQAPKSDKFDDIVAYGMKKKIMPPRNIAAPIQIDALACENANAVINASRTDLNDFASTNGSTTSARADAIYKAARKIAELCENKPQTDLRPASLTNLALWLDADDALTVFTGTDCIAGAAPADAAAVACLKDKSGGGYNSTQLTSNNRPIYKTAIKNGRSILRFNGTSQLLSNSNMSLGTTVSFFAVASTNNVNGFRRILSNEVNLYFGIGNATKNFASFFGNGSAWQMTTDHGAGAVLTAGTYYILTAVLDGTNDNPFVNGVNVGQRASAMSAFSDGYVLGGHDGITQFWSGDIAEIIVYNRAISTNERTGIESYLSNKWGVGTPATNQCPTGLVFKKTAAIPQGSCQCPIDGQVLFQELNNTSACFAGQNITFNKCVANPDTSVTYTSPPPTAGMGLWLDANDCSTIKLSPGGKVNKWLDKSPAINTITSNVAGGNHVLQGVDAKRPLYITNTLNSKPIIRFDGVDDALSSSSTITNAPGDEITVMAVAGLNATSQITEATPTIAAFGSSAGSLGWKLYYDGAGYSPSLVVKRTDAWGSNVVTHNTSSSQTTKNYVLATGITSGGKTTIFVNGQQVSSTANAGSIDYGSSPKFYIGSGALGNRLFKGDIAEILVYNRALTTNERIAIARYLGHKWQLFFDPISPKDPIAPFALNNGIANTLTLWLDATDTTTVSTTASCPGTANNGNTVYTWCDKAPTPNNVVQATTTAQPTYNIARLNGKPAISFNGTSNVLYNTTTPFNTGAWTGATAFFVLQDAVATPPSVKQTVFNLGSASLASYSFSFGTIGLGMWDGAGAMKKGPWIANLIPTPELLTYPHMYEAQFTENDTGTNTKLWVDGVETTYTYNSASAAITFVDGVVIGASAPYNSATLFASVDIGEIVMYSNTVAGVYMTDIDRKKIEAYLSSKWSIPVTP